MKELSVRQAVLSIVAGAAIAIGLINTESPAAQRGNLQTLEGYSDDLMGISTGTWSGSLAGELVDPHGPYKPVEPIKFNPQPSWITIPVACYHDWKKSEFYLVRFVPSCESCVSEQQRFTSVEICSRCGILRVKKGEE